MRKDKDWQTATDVPHLKTIVDASRTPLAIAGNDADDAADDTAVAALVKQRSVAMATDADADSDNDSACDAEPYATPQRWAAPDPTPPSSPGLGPGDVASAGGPGFPPPERCQEMIEYVEGDAVALVDAAHSSVRIVAHCAAEGGGWISRGAMGQISKLGDEPREEYESWNPALGVCQVVKVSDPYLAGGQLFVATLVCQTMSPTKGKPPNIDREGFEAAVSVLMLKAREKRASLHVYKPMDASADWAAIVCCFLPRAHTPTQPSLSPTTVQQRDSQRPPSLRHEVYHLLQDGARGRNRQRHVTQPHGRGSVEVSAFCCHRSRRSLGRRRCRCREAAARQPSSGDSGSLLERVFPAAAAAAAGEEAACAAG